MKRIFLLGFEKFLSSRNNNIYFSALETHNWSRTKQTMLRFFVYVQESQIPQTIVEFKTCNGDPNMLQGPVPERQRFKQVEWQEHDWPTSWKIQPPKYHMDTETHNNRTPSQHLKNPKNPATPLTNAQSHKNATTPQNKPNKKAKLSRQETPSSV